jgi:hypothetical protein
MKGVNESVEIYLDLLDGGAITMSQRVRFQLIGQHFERSKPDILRGHE